jgi:chemosensory pili system protein ChpA (sensor histidine kinase/response regulator)
MNDINSQTLHVVAKELSATLADARVSLEAYAERLDQRNMLENCAEQLHIAHGVLRLVEVYGAALLAEEMELVARYLLQVGADEKRHADGLDSLMRSMVQLPTYLDRVLSGGRDMALILLPLLNDLRAVRGTPLLSEGTLLLLNLKSDQPAQPRPPTADEPALDAVTVARRLRSRFQIGLLGVIRDEIVEHNLGIMAQVAAKLEQAATTQPLFQFWWVTGAVIEALQTNGLEPSATIKRLLGQADRQIKLLGDLGEQRYSENPPVDLLNNLLFCVSRSSTDGGRIGAVRKSFKLAEVLPVDDSIELERESLSAPSVKLMHTVAVAIKEDLAKVKDVLDIFVRRGGGQTEELRTQLDLLKKISDTLGVLGLGQLRQRVQDEITELNKSLSGGMPPPESALIKIAGVLLSVEDNLDEHLVRLILPAGGEAAQPETDDHEFRQVSEAVLRECIVNLARVKDAVSATVQNTGETSPPGLDSVPQLLRGITAGLLMLGKTRAVGLMDAVGAQVRRLIELGAPKPDAQRLERIADAIVSLEYYMETIQSGRADPWYMLDNAETCLNALLEEGPSRLPTLEARSAEPGAAAQIQVAMPATPTEVLPMLQTEVLPVLRTEVLPVLRTEVLIPVPPAPAPEEVLHAVPPEAAHPPTVVLPAIEVAEPEIDPQMIEVFTEEAAEVVASINKVFPQWEQNPDDADSLSVLRRNFHTLKGSGRMVGARTIGNFAWAIENLLNRVMAKTLVRTAGMTTLLRAAVAALPQLVEQLQTDRALPASVDDIMARAFAYAEGRDPEQQAVAEESHVHAPVPEAPPAEPAPAGHASMVAAESQGAQPVVGATPASPAGAESGELAPAAVDAALEPAFEADAEAAHAAGADDAGRPAPMDPLLHEIYSNETANHLEQIREYLRKRGGHPAPHDLPEAVYRAIHTLSGSSKMADARHGIRVTEPLNHYMRKVFDSGRGLPDAGLVLLADVVAAIENVVSHIDEETGFFGEQPLLRERIQKLEAELDAELAHSLDEAAASESMLAADSLLPAEAAGSAGAGNAAGARSAAGATAAAGAGGGLRPRDREHLQRRGYRAARGGTGLARGVECESQRQAALCRTAASATHAEGRRAHGRHCGDGRSEP